MRLSGLRDELTLVVDSFDGLSFVELSLLEPSFEELSLDELSLPEVSFEELPSDDFDFSSFLESLESWPPSEEGAWDFLA